MTSEGDGHPHPASCVVVRVWLPDRPGALGQVASRIGAVRGDVVGIDILERGAGRAIDELVVTLPEPGLVDLLVQEIGQVDGVDVEDVRMVEGPLHDAAVEALETAARLAEASSEHELLHQLCADAHREFAAEWCAVLHRGEVRAGHGDVPNEAWVRAFLEGARFVPSGPDGIAAGPDDVAWAALPRSGVEVALGRHGRPLRQRERRQLVALVRVADVRLVELAARVR
jgi:hypothetical protein